jgi:hypothetical protein
MARITYSHLVEYDEAANKIAITRIFSNGTIDFMTELRIDDVPADKRNFEDVSRILGETLILDMRKLCDEVLP